MRNTINNNRGINMKLQRRLGVWLGILCGGLFMMTGCDSDDDDSTTSCLRTGLFDYTLSINADFGNGVEYTSFSGRTIVSATSDGFFFKGGEGDRREITIKCLNDTSAVAEILLHNSCSNNYTTTATATVDTTVGKDENGSLTIHEYPIQWTCGSGGVSYLGKEQWYLTLAQ